MAQKSFSLIMIFALAVSASASFGGRKALSPAAAPAVDPVALAPGADFGFVPLSTKDPKVVQMAQYAIDEYNKASNSKLVYSGVFEALYTEGEKGTNYGLVVAATNEKKELNDFEVNVFVDKANDAEIVTSFKKTD